MKINKKAASKKKVIIILIVLVLLVASAFIVWFFYLKTDAKVREENSVSYDPATELQQNTGLDAKADFNEKYYSDQPEEEESADQSKEVEVLISSIGQTDNQLTIATSVYTVNEPGTCRLVLGKEGSENITREAKLHSLATYSACEDFNIDTSILGKGEWNISVEYEGSETFGSTVSKVTLK